MPTEPDLKQAISNIELAFPAERNTLEPARREQLAEIIALTDQVWVNPLGPIEQRYRAFCRMQAAECVSLFPYFLAGNLKPQTWAAAILWSVVKIDRLCNPSLQPILSAADIAAAFGVSPRTLEAKSRMIVRKRMRAQLSQLNSRPEHEQTAVYSMLGFFDSALTSSSLLPTESTWPLGIELEPSLPLSADFSSADCWPATELESEAPPALPCSN